MHVPALIRERSRAIDFPDTYANALRYLEQCAKLDEVKEFSDKVAAAATYYKQKNDVQAIKWLRRIQLRAAIALGHLLTEIENSASDNDEIQRSFADRKLQAFLRSSTVEEGADAMEEEISTEEWELLKIPARDRRHAVSPTSAQGHQEIERAACVSATRMPDTRASLG